MRTAWQTLVGEHPTRDERGRYVCGECESACVRCHTAERIEDEREAAYIAGLADGARGRGSRARYRRAVVAAIEDWTTTAASCDTESAYCAKHQAHEPYGPRNVAYWRRRAARMRAAARRARRILAALDAGRPGGAW